MLIQFRVENHRSLRDEQVLSFVAADALDPGDGRLIHAEGLEEALLPAVALYGANASGKSNVVGALAFMRDAVMDSHRLWKPDGGTPQEPFALSDKQNEPSLYEVDFLLSGTRYRYGFLLGAKRIEEEWLHAWHDGEVRVLFEREQDIFQFGGDLPGENETIKALTRPNSLFLSAAAQNNHAFLSLLFGWFSGARFELRHGPSYAQRGVLAGFLDDFLSPSALRELGDVELDATQRRRRDAILHLLGAADIGIIDLRVEERPVTILLDNGRGLSRPYRGRTLYFRHRTEEPTREVWLPASAQSAGTRTLLEIAVHLVRVLEQGTLLCIDELEASLHPMLALELVRLFNDPTHNPRGAQLVFTTHDTNLLGNVLGEPPLRRDQVWFTEKDRAGATHLYPLTDFHPRAEENLERGYLQGRYGAVPYLGLLVTPRDETKEGVHRLTASIRREGLP